MQDYVGFYFSRIGFNKEVNFLIYSHNDYIFKMNIKEGYLNFLKKLISFDGTHLQLNLTLKYIQSHAELGADKLYSLTGFPKGFKTNFLTGVCQYDSYGNPTTYRGKNMTWIRGNLLSSVSNNASTISFSYDDLRRRERKITSSGTTTYSYLNNLLFREDRPNHTIFYIYSNNELIGFTLDNNIYLYEKNIFNDVVRIIDINDNVISSYEYDAWGNHKVFDSVGMEDTDSESVGNINPYRYRSYYYDVETGLYWLSSRYYDPEIGRFISPDSVDYLDPTSINGLNLYAYCNNDPVNYCDPSGHSAILIGLLIGAVIGLVAGVGYAAYKDYSDDNSINGSIGVGTYIGYGLLGGVGGGLLGAGIGYALPVLPTFAASSFAIGGGISISGGAAVLSTGITITGAQVLEGVGILAGLGIMYMSKHRPGMTNRPPFSWTNQDEGIEAMKRFGGDANRAADYIMNNHFDSWKYGAGNDRNVIKK